MQTKRQKFMNDLNSMGGVFHAQDEMFDSSEKYHHMGISMLEYYAGQALAGVMARESNLEPQKIAKKSFAIAEAMIVEFRKISAEKANHL